MSYKMNDVMGAAKNGFEAAKETTEEVYSGAKDAAESIEKTTVKTVSNVIWTVLKGASTAAGILSTLRKLDRDDGLAWFGLARRRNPLVSVALFGSGVAVGAGIGLLFAPMTGADLRSSLLGRTREVKHKGAEATSRAEAAIKEGAEKVVERGAEIAEAVKHAERKVEAELTALKGAVVSGASAKHADGVHTAKA